MHRLSASFILGYHGCERSIARRLVQGEAFTHSNNEYDWLGSGIYFWEANPLRGLEFAVEVKVREPKRMKHPAVIGSVIDLGYCLDLTTSRGLGQLRRAYERLAEVSAKAGHALPVNQSDRFKHNLDCAVINYLHYLQAEDGKPPFDTVKALFIEPPELYPGSSFGRKNHVQVVVRNAECIKGVFRVAASHLDPEV